MCWISWRTQHSRDKNSCKYGSYIPAAWPNRKWLFHAAYEKVADWYSYEVMKWQNHREELSRTEVKFKLSTVKPLHSKWLIETYNRMASPNGREICKKVGKKWYTRDPGARCLGQISLFDDIYSINEISHSVPVIEKIYISET